jgi:hypothetical protein
MDIPKEYLEKKESLAKEHGPVHLLYVKKLNGESVVFLKEPKRHQKMAIADHLLATKEKTTAGGMLIEACIIREHSDESIFLENAESDKVYLAMCLQAINIIEIYNCELKKN